MFNIGKMKNMKVVFESVIKCSFMLMILTSCAKSSDVEPVDEPTSRIIWAGHWIAEMDSCHANFTETTMNFHVVIQGEETDLYGQPIGNALISFSHELLTEDPWNGHAKGDTISTDWTPVDYDDHMGWLKYRLQMIRIQKDSGRIVFDIDHFNEELIYEGAMIRIK